MKEHFTKIMEACDMDARAVAFHKCILEVFGEDILGTFYSKKQKEGWFIDVTTPEHIITFNVDCEWGFCSLSIMTHLDHRFREVWCMKQNDTVLVHRILKEGRLQIVD